MLKWLRKLADNRRKLRIHRLCEKYGLTRNETVAQLLMDMKSQCEKRLVSSEDERARLATALTNERMEHKGLLDLVKNFTKGVPNGE